MTWEEKCRLIPSDPVTCAHQFDYQVQTFIRQFLLSHSAPLGDVNDWFYRVEFQQRGSPHIHMLIWIRGAPKFGINNDAHVIHSIITCSKPPDERQALKELVTRQVPQSLSHLSNCEKLETVILYSLADVSAEKGTLCILEPN